MIALGDEPQEDEGLDVYIMPLGSEAKDLAMQIITMLRANGLHVIWINVIVLKRTV